MYQPLGDGTDEDHHLTTNYVASSSSIPGFIRPRHDDPSASRIQYSIPRKPIPRHDYSVAPMDTEDATPQANPALLSWRPLYLRTPVLCGFVAFFCITIAALETMFQVSQRKHGLADSSQKLHYLWTYGPSAVLIMISALWARVEYQAKELAPWHSMVGKEVEATKSILLDYVSVLAPISIVHAFRNRHHSIALITICGLLMKVLIIFSTALLVLSSTLVDRDNAPLILTTTFGGSATDLNRTGTIPLTMLTGIQEKGVQYPAGLTADLAYQTFTSPANTSGATLGASVQAFVGSLECEEAQLIVDSWYLITGGGIPVGIPPLQRRRMQFIAGDCHITDTTIDASDRITTKKTSGYFGTIRPGWCNSSSLDMRLVVAMGMINPGAVTNVSNSVGTKNTNVTVASSRQFICKPVYSMKTARVTLNQTANAVASVQSISTSNLTTPFTDVQGWNFLAIQYYDPQLGIPTSVQSQTTADLIDYRILLAMKQAGMSNTTYADMMQGDNLVTAAKKFFGVTSALYAHVSLRRSANMSVSGTSQAFEPRLQVKELPVRVMESILALIAISTVFVILHMSGSQAVPRCPSTLLDVAALLNRSQGLLRLLHGAGSVNMDSLHNWLGGRLYSSGVVSAGVDNHFCVSVSHQGLPSPQSLAQRMEANRDGWQPFTICSLGRILAGVVLVSLIVVSELLLWYSQKHTGFDDVSLQGYTHYSWAYAPATVLVLVSLWFSAIDFDLRCVGPYFGLEKGDSASRTIGLSYMNDLSGTTLVKSFKMRHWAISTTSLASLVGSTLTIAVAGCFLTTNVPLDTTTQLQVNSWFNSDSVDKFTSSQSELDYGTTIAGLVLYANLSYPPWTYDELALPQLSTVNLNSSTKVSTENRSGEIRVRTVATRSNLNCTFFQRSQLNYTLNNGSLAFNAMSGNCKDTTLNKIQLKTGIFGEEMNFRNCFSEMFVWGEYDGRNVNSLSAAGCEETFNEVDVDVTLSSPSLVITQPPVEYPSTLRESNAYNNDWSRINLPTVSQTNDSNLDPFFLAVVYGRDGIPLSNLGVSSNATLVLNRIKRVQNVVRAQYFGEYLRTPTNATNTPLPLSANLTLNNRLRLVQDPISSRILELLLAIMLLCTIIATVVQPNTHNAVPKNPCSIAAKASLLADSSLATREFLPEDADKLSDEELAALAGKTKFGIGWFKALRTNGSGKVRVYKVEKMPPVLNDRITHNIAIDDGFEVQHEVPVRTIQKDIPLITITSRR